MTLSEDGQWMWNGNQWVPAQNAPPAAPPAAAQPGFSDPNNQSWNAPQPFGGQPMAPSNPGGWAPDRSSPSAKKSLPVAAIVAVVILIVAGATGGILWATGVFGSSGDELVGNWYDVNDYDENEDGIMFKSNGEMLSLENGNPDYEDDEQATWSVSGDILTITVASSESNDDESSFDNSVQDFKYQVIGDFLYLGMVSQTVTIDGSETTTTVSGDICENGFCIVFSRSTNAAEVDAEANSPSWFSYGGGFATDQPESGTRNSYTADDAAAETTDGSDDVLISMRWMHAEDDLNWAFVVLKLSIGDNTYDCAIDASADCIIGRDGSDNNVWETDEFLTLSENYANICGGSGACQIDIYVTYRGTAVAGDNSVVVA